MSFKLKLQVLITPFIVFIIVLISLIFVNNSRDSISQLQFEIMDYKLSVLQGQCDSEHSILARLNLENSPFYLESAQSKIIKDIENFMIPGGYIFVISSNNELRYHPNGINESFGLVPELRQGINQIDSTSQTPIRYIDKGTKWVAFIKTYEPWDWHLVAVAKEDVIYSGISESIKLAVITGVVAILIALIVVYFISKSISKPIEKLIKGSIQISKGDLNARVHINTKDEFSILASSFNEMARQLNESFDKIQISMRELQKISNDLKSKDNLLKATFNQAYQLIGVLNTKGEFIEVNDTGLAFVNSKLEDVLYKHIWDTPFWGNSIKEMRAIKRMIDQALEGKFTRRETLYKNKINLDFSMKPVFDGNKKVAMIIVEARDITDLIVSRRKLKQLNEELEERVYSRTQELVKTNKRLEDSVSRLEETQKELINTKDELESSLSTLQKTQSQLIESEKLAGLGSVVAGISHEINTPMGIAVTLTSHIQKEIREINRQLLDNTLSRTNMKHFISSIEEETQLALRNLSYASDLIAGFKKIAVDQSSHERRKFKLDEYVYEIRNTIQPQLKNTKHTIQIVSEDDIVMDSYPGALFQIFNNLIMNSITHGFKEIEQGQIKITLEHSLSDVKITYNDNGNGISNDIIDRIFDPFFTTARGRGGSGLGLHIVFNLCTSILNGDITCKSDGSTGTTFEINLPKKVY